jgi:DNA (cytosine-5)-methyltransferase 1
MLGDGWQTRPSSIVVPPRHKRDRPIALDFFCGAGGFSLGLMQAGIDVIAGFDK